MGIIFLRCLCLRAGERDGTVVRKITFTELYANLMHK